MSSGFRFALIALLVPLVLTAGVAGQTDARPDRASPWVENTTLVVQLQPDGDARWSVSATYDLSTANRTAAFRTLAEEFRNGETATLGLPAFRRAVDAAETATGRTMEITAVDRTASSPSAIANGTGRLTLSFTWTNFARVEGDRLVVGDAFDTPGQTWLSGLDDDQRLVLEPPEGYAVYSASATVPAPQNGTIVWEGPRTFGRNGFSVTFTGDGSSDGGPPDGDGDGPESSGNLLWLAFATLTLGVGVVVAYVVVQRRDGSFPVPESRDRSTDGEATSAESDADADPEPAAPESTGEDTDRAEVEDESGGGGVESEAKEDEEKFDEELLSDEERVERLLEENGGRMKQASIVSETGWSNAKVSQLLSSMEEEDRIDKLRIGRENLISFPDENVTDVDEE